MMKLTQRMRYLAFILFLGVLFYAITSGTASAAASHSSSSTHIITHSVSLASKGTPAWIEQAQPYVRMTNGMATINSTIQQHLSSSDITKVQQSVNHYNSLPLSLKLHGMSGQSRSIEIAHELSPNTPSGTSFRWTIDYYWWGIRVWVNSDLAQALAAGSTVPALLLAAVPPIALLIVIYSAAVLIDNYGCGDQGVFLDFPYFAPSHPTPICQL